MATVRLKECSIPVIPHFGGISKNVSSTFMKSDGQQTQQLTIKAYPETTVVIQPGSRYLKIGKAKAAFPVIVPHCIAYKLRDTATLSGSISMYNRRQEASDGISTEWFEGKVQELHAKRYKKLPPNFYQNLRAFNDAQAKTNQRIPIHNDSFHIDYTDPKNVEFVCGVEALRLDPGDKQYLLRWPLEGGRFARGVSWRESVEDMQRIWTKAIVSELEIPHKDLSKWSAVIVIDDSVEMTEIRAYTEMALTVFKSVAFLKASQAACIGAGCSSALVIDCGAQKTQVSVVEDGVICSTAVSAVGGDSMLQLFHDLLQLNHFPCKHVNLQSPLDFEMMEQELWLKQCSLDEENELTATAASVPVEFFRRHPGSDTTVHSVKMLDERCIPILSLFDDDFGFLCKHEMMKGDGDGEAMVMYDCENLTDMIQRCLLPLSDSPDRLMKLKSSVLLTGGALPAHTHQNLVTYLLPATELVNTGIDARQVAWKGGAVMAKLDSFAEYCFDLNGWTAKGERLFAERLPFSV